MKKLIGFIKGLVKGGAEASLIPSVLRGVVSTVKKLKTSGARDFLDVNGDGKRTFADIEALKWEQIGKIVAVVFILGVILWLAAKYGVPLI